MVGITVIALLVWDDNLDELRHMHLWVGLLLIALIVGPWLYLLGDVGGVELVRNFLIDNNFGRFCSAISSRYTEHSRSFFYYFYDFLGNFLPWTPIFFPALVWALKQSPARQITSPSFYRFLSAGFLLNILLASFSSTKRGVYILPLYPLAALMVGGWLDELLAGRSPAKWERMFLWLQTALVYAAPLTLVAVWGYMEEARLPSLCLLGVSCFVLTALTFRELGRGHLLTVAFMLGAQVILTYTLIVQLIFPLISPYKQYTPFFERVAGVVRPGDVVLACANIHEANLGQACISLNQLVPVLWNQQRLVSMLTQKERRVFIFVEEWNYFDIKPLLPPSTGVYWSQAMAVPLRHYQKPILRCLTNLTGAQRPMPFQTLEKDTIPLSKHWKMPGSPCKTCQP